MKLLQCLFALGLLMTWSVHQCRAVERSSSSIQVAGKSRAKPVENKRKKVASYLHVAAQMILSRNPQRAMVEIDRALRLDTNNARAKAYRMVVGDLLEISNTAPPKKLNGTPGNWRACRGTGAHVCVEKIPLAYGSYWIKHPDCIPNGDCKGRYYTCNKACPAPCEEDKD